MVELGTAYWNCGRNEEAEHWLGGGVDLLRRLLGPEHHLTMAGMNNLAMVYSDERRYGDAEALIRQVLDLRRRVHGPEDNETLTAMNNLAVMLKEVTER